MSIMNSNNGGLGRKHLLATVAALTFVASGFIGGAILTPSTPVKAAAVITSGLEPQAIPSFAPIVERVKPAVVAVKVTIENASASADELSSQWDNLPPEMREFLKRFGDPNGGEPRRRTPQRAMAQGSGFFISSDGYVVTNNHVVEHAKSVTVTTDAGKTLAAKVIGTDPKTDLALLKVTEKGDYPYVALASDSPKVGDWVLAIGNPFGLGGTVTAGIVSANGRDIGSGPYDDYLQIDAPINKGNSGGPTFNLKGQVVGVNTAIFSPSGGSVGLAFAIPASTVGTVVNSLEHGGVVSRGYLGVQIQPINEDIAESLGLKGASGALIDQAMPGTPAAKAGLKSGDVITRLNGQPIKDARELTRKVGALKPGDKAQVTFLRNGKERTVALMLSSQKNEKVAKAEPPQSDDTAALGIQLAPAKDVAGAGDKGVAVVGVDPDGVAANKGITDGDVILEVSGKTVNRPEDVKAGVAAVRQEGRKAVLLKIKTADGTRFVAVPLPKA